MPANERLSSAGAGYVGAEVIRRRFDATATQGQLSQLAVRAYLLVLGATLGGCSASEVPQNWTPASAVPTAPDLSQPNYHRVFGDNIRTIFPNVASLAGLGISDVRLVDHLKGPAWLTCLKFHAPESPGVAQSEPPTSTTTGNAQYYAIFIQGDKIIDSRMSVVIDQCHKETFQPFDLASPSAAKKG
jgi:hypothetical protein